MRFSSASPVRFPNPSDSKVKRQIFYGPEITEVTFTEKFERKLNSTTLTSRKYFESFVRGFPGEGVRGRGDKKK